MSEGRALTALALTALPRPTLDRDLVHELQQRVEVGASTGTDAHT